MIDPPFDLDLLPDPNFKVPDLIQAVEGWRVWRVQTDLPRFGTAPKMYSATHSNYYWKPRKISTAECNKCKENVPGESCSCGFYCLPLDTDILTERGWLAHDQVRVGDRTLGINPATRMSEWTTVRRIIHTQPQAVYRVGNDYWSARASGDHRWPAWLGDRQEFLTTLELPGEKGAREMVDGETSRMEVVTKLPYVGGSDLLTPAEARLIGWFLTDGHPPSRRLMQKKPAGVAAIRGALAGVPYTEHSRPDGMIDFYVRSIYFKRLWAKAGLGERSPMQLVASLTRPALVAFMEAVDQADGTTTASGQKWITQNVGPMLDAINLGMYLLGYRPRVRLHDPVSSFSPGRGVGRRLTYATSPIRRPQLQTEYLGMEPTWCVTTDLGTWTMRQDEHVLPTGNSAKTFEHLMGMSYHHYDMDDGYVMVLGQVANWGKVIEGTQGWRAANAYPVRLWVPFESWKIAEALEEGYGVPVGLKNYLKPAARAVM